jgi:hypothetical protein
MKIKLKRRKAGDWEASLHLTTGNPIRYNGDFDAVVAFVRRLTCQEVPQLPTGQQSPQPQQSHSE